MTLQDGTSVEYLHDPTGRRTAKMINGEITEKYLWSGHNTGLLAVYDGSDSLLMRFEYADARMPFAVVKGGVKYYLAYDQIGSLKTVAGSAGNVVKKIGYDSFGNIIPGSDPLFEIPFGFAGACTTVTPGWCGSGTETMTPTREDGLRKTRLILRAGIRICMPTAGMIR